MFSGQGWSRDWVFLSCLTLPIKLKPEAFAECCQCTFGGIGFRRL
jgi:hypothetical protein